MKNILSRSIETVPAWLIQALIGIILTASVSWATWTTTTTNKHETRLTVVEEKVGNVKQDISEIKSGQRRIEDKLDRVIERRK